MNTATGSFSITCWIFSRISLFLSS
jgi:hypothetical protein